MRRYPELYFAFPTLSIITIMQRYGRHTLIGYGEKLLITSCYKIREIQPGSGVRGVRQSIFERLVSHILQATTTFRSESICLV